MDALLQAAEVTDNFDNVQTPEIVASIVDKITFASHQNDIAVIPDLVVRGLQDETLENLELVLECEPAIIASKIWKIDRLTAGTELRIRDRRVSLSGALLSALSERMKAEATLTLRQDEKILAQTQHSITGLARNEWGGAAHMPELLAAFVMPNDPAITTILKQAAEALRSAGQRAALDGYQSRSRQRVWQIASAIWTAVSSRRLVYAEPPASFEIQGQKLRTPSEILEGGLATCLDTTALFAAALEQAGLNSVIAFTQGHAFCGVWLQPQQLSTLTTDDCSELRKYIALKELVLFETTLAVNDTPLPFSKAVSEANRQISEENEQSFVYALDIKRARSQQITPLAIALKQSVNSDENEGTLIQGLEAPPELPEFDFGIDSAPTPDTPETRLDHWKRKLLDLTKRNRLLNLKPSKTAIRLYCSDPAALEDKLAEGKKITVITMEKLSGTKNERDNVLFINRTGDDFSKKFIEDALDRDEVVSDMPQSDLDSGMVELYRKAKTDLQEGGANTLYLALGVLKWKQSETEERSYRAPLILVPVKLERKSAASKVKILQHEDEPVFNMTLLEMLRQDFDLRLPELEGELPKDHSGIDVPRVWEIVKKAVRDVPGFEVVEETVLSTFSFAKYLMWKDLADRTDALKKSNFVQHLIDKPRDPYIHSAGFISADQVDEKINPSELFMPLPADSSQVVAVHASAKGGDFILEGPPGTGKSQTIGNIIAHNLALGRKVLFVSEKMAALDVVYRRLKEKGLGDFCLELHSNKANKRHILDQLGQSWHNRHLKNKLQWEEEAEKLKKVRSDLNGLVKALHYPGPTGISPRAAIGRAARWQDIHRFRLDWQGGLDADRAKTKEGLLELERAAKQLGLAYGEISTQDKNAFSDILKTEWSTAWQSQIVSAANNLSKAIEQLKLSVTKFCHDTGIKQPEHHIGRIYGLADIAHVIPNATTYNLEFAIGSDYQNVLTTFESSIEKLRAYREKKATLSSVYADDKIINAPIDILISEWIKMSALLWPLNQVKCWAFTRSFQKQFLLTTKPEISNDLHIIKQLQDIKREMDRFSFELPNGTIWRGLDTDIEKAKESISAARKLREGMSRYSEDINELPELRASIKRLFVDGRELLSPGTAIYQSAATLIADVQKYNECVAEFSEKSENSSLIGNNIDSLAIKTKQISDSQSRINSWCRWQAAKKEAATLGISSLVDALENEVVKASDSEECFKTAYCAWISDRLIDDRQELRTFSSLEHEEKISNFRKLDQNLADLSVDYIRAKLSSNIPAPESNNRPPGYGILSHELQKKMRHKPVRQLIAEMGDALTSLTPCLLMSPLSVSQFLSADNQLFDLVVFDEASQITVWDAIGAIARGKNVVVVGDPKQMPPTSFFDRAASEDSEDDNNFDDLESILDEALAASVKLHRLTGHYRSRHESLIAFSNHRYYGGELVTYPSSETKQSAVSFVKVDGLYQRGKGRTNPDEAKAVVKEVVKRLTTDSSSLSIGVVALNSEQQKLIDDLLDAERKNNPELEKFFSDEIEEPVFVKNLETVQGDQRDVILLSIGYGPDTPGAATMSMNFGPLNRKGGERRLNVAITRATSEVVIFSSFDPGLIDLTRTSANAVRDLKHYLEFAQRGPSALGEAILSVGGIDAYDSDFEEAVANGLRKKGWIVHTQIGVSKFRIDLGIVHPDFPGKYLVGVECDGAAYHSSPSAKDRDRVRQSILQNLGWNLLRIWSTDYWIDSERVLDNVHNKLSQILQQDREKNEENAKKDATVSSQSESTIQITPDDISSQIEDFEIDNIDEPIDTVAESKVLPQALIARLSANRFYEKEYLQIIDLLACSLIDSLGPITFRHVSTKIARAHGFQRTGSQIKKQVWAAISNKRKYTKAPNGETIFWPELVSPREIMQFRGMNIHGETRVWQDIPHPEKLGMAIQAYKTSNGDCISAMARSLGLERLKQSMKQELENLVEEAKNHI